MARRTLKNIKTLVLNADYSPISFTSLRRALALCANKHATALEISEDRVCSESMEFERPSVVVLSRYRKLSPQRAVDKSARPSRSHVLSRDMFTCRYCGAPATSLDHVHPRSRGGESTWDNLVASCVVCNQRKGAKLLRECALKLRAPPQTPRAASLILRNVHLGIYRSLLHGDENRRPGKVYGQHEWQEAVEGSPDMQAWMKYLVRK